MKTIIALALAILAPSVSFAKEVDCSKYEEKLPFKLPSAKVTAAWTDTDFDRGAATGWAEYCNPASESPKLAAMLRAKRAKACSCAPQ
jgi:hypothetical protein